MMYKFVRACALISFGLILSQQAYANNYLGIGVGKAEAEVEDISLGDDTGLKIYGGHKFNPNVAFEAAYIDFGETTLTGNGSLTFKGTGFDFSIVGFIPTSENFNIFGKVGLLLWDAEADYVNVPGFGTGTITDDGSDISFGLGVDYTFDKKFTVRASYEIFQMDDVDLDLLSIGASYNF